MIGLDPTLSGYLLAALGGVLGAVSAQAGPRAKAERFNVLAFLAACGAGFVVGSYLAEQRGVSTPPGFMMAGYIVGFAFDLCAPWVREGAALAVRKFFRLDEPGSRPSPPTNGDPAP